MPISARTQLVGLIGWPVSHSRSPAMHNAAFAALGLDWAYLPLPVPPAPPERVHEAVRGLRALGMRGANITVPHKQAVFPALDQISPAAQAMGAVNTIRVTPDGRLLGENTDAAGFAADLLAHGVAVEGRQALVLGAGGSARAIVHALAGLGASQIAVANRSEARAHHLIADLQPLWPAVHLLALPLQRAPVALGHSPALVVNTTALGVAPATEGLAWDEATGFAPEQTVYDLVYAPEETRLLALARRCGARAIGGLGMLVHQGAIAFEMWTGEAAPLEVMRAAAATA